VNKELEKCRFRVDKEIHALRDSDHSNSVVLTGKPYDLLLYLMGFPNRIVSTRDIKLSVWGKTQVTDGSVKDYISKIRLALRDSAINPKYIETVRGQGYRYVGNITEKMPGQACSKLLPTIAVIPPLCSGPAKSKKQSDSHEMAGDIIAANLIQGLTHSPLINVISRLSTRRFRFDAENYVEIAEKLGVDYVCSGIFYVLGKKLILSIELMYLNDSIVLSSFSLEGSLNEWSNSDSDCNWQLRSMIANDVTRHEIELMSCQSIELMSTHTMMVNAINFMHNSVQATFENQNLCCISSKKTSE